MLHPVKFFNYMKKRGAADVADISRCDTAPACSSAMIHLACGWSFIDFSRLSSRRWSDQQPPFLQEWNEALHLVSLDSQKPFGTGTPSVS